MLLAEMLWAVFTNYTATQFEFSPFSSLRRLAGRFTINDRHHLAGMTFGASGF